MKISLIHPSRNRPEKAREAFDFWNSRKSDSCEIEYILSLDKTDSHLGAYYSLFQGEKIIVNNNRSLVDATNSAAKESTGDIIVLLSDDFRCPQNWDWLISDRLDIRRPQILKTFDGVQPWIITLPIMTRKFYELFEYVYNPEYLHMFCDTEMTTVAHYLNYTIYANDLLFPHHHHSITGTPDKVSEKADATWYQGERVYLERFKTNFGIPEENIMQWLGNNGSLHHYAWCKSKGYNHGFGIHNRFIR